MGTDFREGLWRLADPKISITSAASMAIGAGVAWGHDRFSWSWLAVLGVAMFCMEVAKNAEGDVIDYDSGTDLAVKPEDRTAFSGGKRVMVDELLTRAQTWAIAAGFSFAGITLGAAMVFFREPTVFWVGAVGLALGWSYHGPPLKLAYRGLGELDVALCYGPAIALATQILMTGAYSLDVLWLSLPLGVFIAAFLWVNEFPDHDADVGAGKRNLVARLGKHRAAKTLPFLYALAFIPLAILPIATGLPRAIWLGFLALPPAALAMWWTHRDPMTFYRHKPAQPMALLAFVLYAAGVTAGIILGG